VRLLKPGDEVRAKVPKIGECTWVVEEVYKTDAEVEFPQIVVASQKALGRIRFEWFGTIGSVFNSRLVVRFHREASTPAPGSVWRHRNGAVCRVLFVTNQGHLSGGRPPDVVYESLDPPERKWSHPLADWARSFTPKQGEQ